MVTPTSFAEATGYTKERCADSRCTAARLYAKGSERMDEVGYANVTLTVTAPPCWNAIDYGHHAEDPTQSYRTASTQTVLTTTTLIWPGYPAVFAETLRKTRPGGYLAVVIGTVLLQGVAYPVPFDLEAGLTRQEWLFHQDIVWHKSMAGMKRAGVFVQHPYPGYYPSQLVAEFAHMPLDAPLGYGGRAHAAGRTRHGSGLASRESKGDKGKGV